MRLGEQEITAVLAAVPVPTLLLRRRADDAFTVAGHNDAAARLTGGAVSSLLGRTVDEVYGHVDDAAADVVRAASTGETVVRELRVRLASTGDERTMRAHVIPLGADLVMLQGEDLTEARRGRELAGTVVASLQDGLIAVDAAGAVVLANQAAAEILGVPLEQLYAGTPWYEAFDARPGDLSSEGDRRDVVMRMRGAGGVSRWVSVSYQPMREGDLSGGLIVAFRDVTRRRRAEAQFESAFSDAPIGMSLIALDGAYLRVNEALCQLVGRPCEEVEQLRWPDLVHPDDRADAEAALQAVVAGDEPPQRMVQRFCRPGGACISVEKTMSVVRDPSGAGEYLVCQVVDVSDRSRYEAELEHRALHDPLTDLPNRALFNDRLQHALTRAPRTREAVAVVFVDLDEFKRVNDSLGHSAGDQVLHATARRLERVMRADDTVCRFGGDEFVVLCEGLDVDDARPVVLELGQRVLAAIRDEPFSADGEELVLGGSAGIALALPDKPVSAERLVAESDAAMYRAKRRRTGEPELAHDETYTAVRRLSLERDLREALRGGDRDGLWLAYQPIMDLAAGRLAGFEALLRWDRAGEAVMPDELLPVAHDAGLIVELGRWVVRRAVADLARWPVEVASSYLAINVDARQFASTGLVDELRDTLTSSGVDPARLSIEITETDAMADAESALATMRELKDVGVRIAIDDFGTGFSSLGYLKRFPADTVKIDRAFMSDVASPSEDRAIVEAVLSMAFALGLDVVAEGVETEAQRTALAGMGCRNAQGFLFARPAPLARAIALAG